MKLRKYRVYWTKANGIDASKEIEATNIDELIDILREVIISEGIENFTVTNPEGITILTETDLVRRK